MGYGIRFSSYFDQDIHHVSAPPNFYNEEATQDSLFLTNPQQDNLTIFIGATYLLKNKVELGFNIDAVGYTFGAEKTGTFTGDGVESETTASPNSVSALLVGANDIGMLKGEFIVGYKVNENWKARIGLSTFVIEYRTPTELQTGNTRFRTQGAIPFLGVTYTL